MSDGPTPSPADRPTDDPPIEVLSRVLDALPHPSALLDASGTPVFVNAAERAYLGMPEGADSTGAPAEFIHPDDFHAFPETVEKLLRGSSGGATAEARIRRADGAYRWHICTASAIRDARGAISYWLVTFVDIEQHRRLEAELHAARAEADESLALLDTLQRSAPIGFALVDRDFRFQRINDSLAEINGIPAEDHLGRHVGDVVPDLWDQIKPIYDRVLAGESVLGVEITGETPARPGERRHWLASYYPVRIHAGEPVVGIGVIAMDVTGERALADQLNQAQKMQAVGQLAGGVAHDFNNVLATVMLTAELLAAGTDDSQLQAGLARILVAARSATDLTGKLLLFARQQPTDPQPVDVPSAVDRVLAILGGTVTSAITVDVDVEGCPPVLIDPTHLEQVLLNLVINARDAMPHGGRLSVTADEVASGTGLDGSPVQTGLVALTVADTGHGMSAEVRDRALEPFFTTKGAGRGTGLGLSTVHGIVSAAGGHISIFSEPEGGTAVRVEIPVAGQQGRGPASVSRVAERGHGERLLLVEDQHDLRRVVEQILVAAGYSVSSAATGDEAAAMLVEAGGPDVLLSDVVMPGMSGPELAHKLAEVKPGTPVVFMSGYTGGVLESHGLLGEHPVLTKPFTSEELLAAVSDALRGTRSRHA